jgi:hypothetical protein
VAVDEACGGGEARAALTPNPLSVRREDIVTHGNAEQAILAQERRVLERWSQGVLYACARDAQSSGIECCLTNEWGRREKARQPNPL